MRRFALEWLVLLSGTTVAVLDGMAEMDNQRLDNSVTEIRQQ